MNSWNDNLKLSFSDFFEGLGFEVEVSDTVLSALIRKDKHVFEFNLNRDLVSNKDYIYCQFTKYDEEDGAFFFFSHEVGSNIPFCAARILSSSIDEIDYIVSNISSLSILFLDWFIGQGFNGSSLIGFDSNGKLEKDSINGVIKIGHKSYVDYKSYDSGLI